MHTHVYVPLGWDMGPHSAHTQTERNTLILFYSIPIPDALTLFSFFSLLPNPPLSLFLFIYLESFSTVKWKVGGDGEVACVGLVVAKCSRRSTACSLLGH